MDLTKAVAVDIETNNLLSELIDFSNFPYKLKNEAKLWCISFCNIGTGEVTTLLQNQITKESVDRILKNYQFIITHNGVKFDLIFLKLFGVLDYKIGWLEEPDFLNGRKVRFLDTLILSRLLSPDRFGGHSLKVWGERLGNYKDNFRQECIEAGVIAKDSPKGSEFKIYSDGMPLYCEQDTRVTSDLFKHLLKDITAYSGWKQAIKMEHKLADLAIRRESLGFWFDKDLAIRCVEDLTVKMQELSDKVNPLLPPKPMNKTELNQYTPPKVQLKKDGTPTASLLNFAKRVGAEIEKYDENYTLRYKEVVFKIPFNSSIKDTVDADISQLDHVKQHLIFLNWVPSEWAVRDLTKDSKKQNLSYEKRLKAFDRWFKETIEGKYTKFRLEDIEGNALEEKYNNIKERLEGEFPVRVLTSPKIRCGVEKDLCPNLEQLGEKVAFAKDFALYLTYKHRKSSIAGGDLEDVDYEEEYPNTGYLASYREEDGRVPTPAIEIGASTNRYRHISIANVARSSSIYGKEMRSLFGCGEGFVQMGFDFSSLEARVQGHYVLKYPFGEELAESLVAEKPDDIHSVNSRKLGIERGTIKSLTYAILYGCSPKKLEQMLGFTPDQAKKFYNDYWDAVPALRDLKKDVETEWEQSGDKEWLRGIDGRKLNSRSRHSLINLLFQSCGVIAAKYVTVFLLQDMENQGLCIDPFINRPDVCSMIEYHDENQLLTSPKLHKFKTFKTEEEAEEFVKNWDNEKGQLSAIGHSEKGYYISLPNVVSKGISSAILKTEKLLNINVPLGFEWITGRNWAQCH